MDNQQNKDVLIGYDDINKESNLRVRKDWRNFKKIILNRDYLIVFIAASILILDLALVHNFSPYLNNKSQQSDMETSATSEEPTKKTDSNTDKNADENNCNVVGINLHGQVVTYIPKEDYNDAGNLKVDEVASESIYFAVKEAEKNENIKAIIVEIDSGGGDPVGGEEMAKVFKNSSKPVVVYIRSVGASAAYWGATGASRIFASPSSQVGSIGVTSSYVDSTKSNQKDGYTFNQLSIGKFKDTMNRNKPLSAEEKALIINDANETYEVFVKTVADNRKLDVKKVKEIANGWAYNGNKALQLGLIDQIGGLDEVNAYLKDSVLNGEEANVCW